MGNSLGNAAGNSVGNSAGNAVTNSVGNAAGKSVRNSVGNSAGNAARNSAVNALGNSPHLSPNQMGLVLTLLTYWITGFIWYSKCSTQMREKNTVKTIKINNGLALYQQCQHTERKILFFFVSTVLTYRKKNIILLCIDSVDIRNLSNLMYH